MRFESVFRTQFHKAADRALSVARRGAFVEGCTYGFACGLIYLAEALLFYFGAVLVARGTYSYLQMVQVLNLVVFTVTIGSQLMAFSTISAAWAGWAQGEEYGSSAPPNLQVTLRLCAADSSCWLGAGASIHASASRNTTSVPNCALN
jgi:hypothetical protein